MGIGISWFASAMIFSLSLSLSLSLSMAEAAITEPSIAIQRRLHEWQERLRVQACRPYIGYDYRAIPPFSPMEKLPALRNLALRPAFLDSEALATDGDQWRRWMSRNRNDPARVQYLVNSREALEIFDRWFRIEFFSDFSEMMDQLHWVTAMGIDGQSFYETVQSGSAYRSDHFLPGLNRGTAFSWGAPRLAAALREKTLRAFEFQRLLIVTGDDASVGELVYKTPFKFQIEGVLNSAKFRTHRVSPGSGLPDSERQVVIDHRPYTLPPLVISRDPKAYVEWSITVETGDESRPRVQLLNRLLVNGWTQHFAPLAEDVNVMMDGGGKILAKFRTKLQNPKTNSTELLDLLANYYHLIINAHVYFRINNSVLMNQVNYLLVMSGHRPVPQRNLDAIANQLNADEFRRYFQFYVSDYETLP